MLSLAPGPYQGEEQTDADLNVPVLWSGHRYLAPPTGQRCWQPSPAGEHNVSRRLGILPAKPARQSFFHILASVSCSSYLFFPTAKERHLVLHHHNLLPSRRAPPFGHLGDLHRTSHLRYNLHFLLSSFNVLFLLQFIVGTRLR